VRRDQVAPSRRAAPPRRPRARRRRSPRRGQAGAMSRRWPPRRRDGEFVHEISRQVGEAAGVARRAWRSRAPIPVQGPVGGRTASTSGPPDGDTRRQTTAGADAHHRGGARGEAGKGFAVVASEVKSLAGRPRRRRRRSRARSARCSRRRTRRWSASAASARRSNAPARSPPPSPRRSRSRAPHPGDRPQRRPGGGGSADRGPSASSGARRGGSHRHRRRRHARRQRRAGRPGAAAARQDGRLPARGAAI
jgi:hypothetical protein